ncbi:DUF4291 domain-containing protein [Actinoallomurus spadix]|uniref:DUF4291 family protein n=1 Tax=Actinoallomurus spadix TaxID=79912 RepID=UPI0020920C0C|nr:DUF4291 family protein [Actinoallomurus spadix]MCO5985711.1 DUF4291 domain-containing protein [Actinoallomurus spadix]
MRTHEIRADHDHTSIVVYQAYRPEIGRPAAEQGRFVPPFSRTRMTWIKPSLGCCVGSPTPSVRWPRCSSAVPTSMYAPVRAEPDHPP